MPIWICHGGDAQTCHDLQFMVVCQLHQSCMYQLLCNLQFKSKYIDKNHKYVMWIPIVEGHHVQLLCITMELHEFQMLDFIYKCIIWGEKMQFSFTSIAKDTQLHNNKVFVNMIFDNVITNILILQAFTIYMETQPILLKMSPNDSQFT